MLPGRAVADDTPITHVDAARRRGRNVGAVGDDEQRGEALAPDPREHLNDAPG